MDHAHCLSPARARAPAVAVTSSSYARLFPDLPAFTADEAFLYAVGRAGGLCDCGDEEDDEASLGTEAAGWPFFGQFVAHDITADRSPLQSHVDPARLRNARSPQLNLECLYGDGPVGHPYLFQRNDPAKLLFGADGQDVLRNGEGTAIIGDPRNDSHVLMSQMHLAFVDANGRPPAARAKKIDGRLVGALIALPVALTGESHVEEFHSLAVRDLERGQGVGLPSGEAVARRLDETPLSRDEIGAARVGWRGETPLWYYVHREADVRRGGNRLRPIGSRIVGEGLVGLPNLDPASVRHAPDDWRPTASLIQLLGHA